ncbi:Gfo/Idh/MocA family oxidoreductase, partial [bacterium]|nr:Gfo/Idh/MocA family oxidoreductase [bacterium]
MQQDQTPSRRQFLKQTGSVAAATTLVASAPRVHAAEDNKIRVVLIGCGGRGTGAALNALTVQNGPHLVGLADVFEKNLNSTYAALSGHNVVGARVDVPEENKFIGFDGYKQAMDLLKPGDLVILATPPAFRWVHYTYAIEKGLNVFMEKPVTVDGPTSARMLE